MGEFEYRPCNSDCRDHESILAQKVFDQCRVQKCLALGPSISAEKCTCIIVHPDEEKAPGRVILPDRQVYLPELVSDVKINPDSFKTDRIQIVGINPSIEKKGHWDIEIVFTFSYKIQLFDVNMKKFKILCCPSDCQSIDECDQYKDYICCSVQYLYTTTLFGSATDFTMASDLEPNHTSKENNTPHVLVESKAYPVDAFMKSPDNECLCEEILDGIYDEPILYIYIKIGIFIIVKLLRLVNIVIESCGYDIADKCDTSCKNPCDLFDTMDFPVKQFFPDQQS